ncbi:hypothetical protein [Paraburkholderia sp. Ac-20336]|uniref:hypothetical protein n=1 Tax=Paraburkholderia sp. Ac-20336 TaxID=2703886 RepID=UPI0019800459|nr:hypothetical protein [Paraburkholderia sp. Ac-20336]
MTIFLSSAALCISLLSLYFTFRKDAHRVRLEITPVEFNCIALGINNDSSYDMEVLSVGYFDSTGVVTWIDRVGDYQTRAWIDYPVPVKGRSMCVLSLVVGRDVPSENWSYGYCVQLATGRIYVLRGSAPWRIAAKMHVASLFSRLSAGRYVIPGIGRIRLPSRR